MDGKLKIIIPVIVVLALGGVAFIMFSAPGGEGGIAKEEALTPAPQAAESTPPPAPGTAAPLPPATGNVDAIVGASIQAATDEQALLDEETGDAALVKSESDVVAEFGQSVNDNDF